LINRDWSLWVLAIKVNPCRENGDFLPLKKDT
jgi:hypothetical protein